MVLCLIIKVLAGLITLSNITKPTKHQEHQSKTEQCLQFIFTQFQIFTLFEVKSKYLEKVNLHLLLPKYIHEVLTKCISKSIKTGSFPDSPRKANIAPILKKSDSVDKCKYRPTSILSLVLKHYEMLTYNQLSKYIEGFRSQVISGFTKTHNTRNAPFALLQTWEKELDNGGFASTFRMDLSKAYDCIPHELLVLVHRQHY